MKVDGSETVNWTLQEAVTKIRGPKGSTVVLTVLRNTEEKPADVSIVRDTITVPAITVWVKTPSEISEISGIPENVRTLKNRRVGYIHLTRFGDRLQTEWPKAVDDIAGEITKGTVAGMILDLRNNPGGYLDGSVYIGSEFLKPQTLIVSQKNSDGSKEEYKVNRPGKLLSVPMVVIINKGSASASEIVAGALKDHKRATVIGETSFGKGSVQTPFDLSGGSGVHITTGKWLTPAGESIMKTGIVPDFEVIQENNDATRDAQLVKALEMILK
ncbi:hypothetical protein A2Z33_01380 [Candidatus Gottesmanbacteria bacterium RBG_16_52_11]|uniref:Tail specific protease domain-containing protein n=1 Tax=Candidatus Gottesmanbacteria bacterium RBG_16_52_11 TaxID=1798374 RepID=A0A1F5YPR0_9BACT|nr:MAG: hypothetical protein A2Z33_01380 [Candidatus Gottesmanbacteria bacterium RBG_16_52_11]